MRSAQKVSVGNSNLERIQQGTEVEVTVPGAIAFKSPSDSDLE